MRWEWERSWLLEAEHYLQRDSAGLIPHPSYGILRHRDWYEVSKDKWVNVVAKFRTLQEAKDYVEVCQRFGVEP